MTVSKHTITISASLYDLLSVTFDKKIFEIILFLW